MNPAPRSVTARTLSSLLLLSALLGAGPAQAQSAGSRIAGPFTVTLPSTKTFSFSTKFRAPTPIQGSYLLRVELGTVNSLTVLSVRLNSVQLYSLADFAGSVTRVDRVVTLLASNTLSLSVAGPKGTRITLTVFRVVMPKPTTLDPNPLPLTIGAGGTLTAMLLPAPTASGSLSVTSSDALVASVPGSVAFAAGQSSVAIAVSALAPGAATVTASANGGQASAVVKVDAPPAVNITAPGANSVYQAGANITISADAADPDGTVARVDFYQGAMLLGSSSAAPYSFTWMNVQPGSYSLTAVATDNQGASSASSAVTIRVNAPPMVSLTSPPNAATFTAPATIPLAATAADSDGSITQVDFYQGSTFIGTVASVPFTFSWTNVTAGSYALTARATDNDGAVSISDVVNITVNSGVAQIYYIVPDHLNTPRMIADQQGTTVWRWDQAEPFGATTPNADPDGDGIAFDFPLRFPGQYFDRETALHYNYFRDYDPVGSRYIESDLVGLRGGINTYAYANNSPVRYFDISGLRVILVGHLAAGQVGRTTNPNSYHLALYLDPDDRCKCSGSWPVTLGAQKVGSKLVGTVNYPGDALKNAAFQQVVPTPPGMTDCEFIRELISTAASYGSDLPYGFPDISPILGATDGVMGPGQYNSNSFASGVLQGAGVNPPSINSGGAFQVPGYSNPIPIQR